MILGGDILVRLIGDGSSYSKMLREATDNTTRWSQQNAMLHRLVARQPGVLSPFQVGAIKALNDDMTKLDSMIHRQAVASLPKLTSSFRQIIVQNPQLLTSTQRVFAAMEAGLLSLGVHYRGVGMEAIRFNSTLSAIAVTAGTIGFARFIQSSLSAAALIEDVRIQLDVLTGSAEEGEKAMSDLWQLAIETPLGLRNVTQGAGVLFQHEAAGPQVAETMRMLGDVAGINSERLGRMVLAYSQVQAEGKLAGQELRQMINAGFNPLAEMARTTGKSMAQLRKEMFDGAISADMVRQAFESATGPGGRFHNMLERRAGTIGGMYEIMSDRIFQAKGQLGAFLVQAFNLKGVMTGLASILGGVVDWFKQLSPETKSMIGSFTTSIAIFGSVRLVVSGLALAIGGLWSVIAASPLGIIPTLAIAATGALALMRTEADRFMTLQGNMPTTISGAREELARVQERLTGINNQLTASQSGMAGMGRDLTGYVFGFFGLNRMLNTNDPVGTGLQDAQLLLEAQQRQLQAHLQSLEQAELRRQASSGLTSLWNMLVGDDPEAKKSKEKVKTLKEELNVREKINDEVRELSYLLRGTSEANLWLYDYARILAVRPAPGLVDPEPRRDTTRFASAIAPVVNPMIRLLNRIIDQSNVPLPNVPQIIVPVPQQSP